MNLFSQSTANYTFSTATTGSLTDMSSGTADVLVPATSTVDVASTVQSIGFNFIFMGTIQTQYSVNSNGQLKFGSVPAGSTYMNSQATATDVPFLNAFWDDLNCVSDQATSSTSKVRSKITGSAPNRCLTVEWKDFVISYNASTATAVSRWQIRIYETTGVIEYVYGNMETATGTGTVTASIGFTNTNANNGLVSVTSLSSPAVTTQTASVSNILVNSSTAGQITGLSSASDGFRRVYTFTPPIPAAPTNLTFTNVGVTSMVVNWSDNATNELSYLIFRSTDGSSYALVSSAAANATSYSATGLSLATTYYWRVVAVTEGAQSAILENSQPTLTSPTLSGTKYIGTGSNPQDYANLTAALNDLSLKGLAGSVILELQSGYSSTGETFPLTFSNFTGLVATNTLKVYPSSGVTGLSITCTTATATIDINNGDYVTIEGRPGGTGSAKELTIANTSTSGTAFRFINDATYNNLKYLTVQGVNISTSSGVIVFSTTTGTTGNDNNTIDNCLLKDGSSTPTNLIYSAGSTGSTALNNSGNIISNNSISNFFSASVASAGILVSSGSTDWNITGNHLFQTATRTSTAGNTHVAISVLTGNNHTITGNYIGGGTTSAGGTAWTIAGTFANRFIGIQIANGTTTASSIQGNFIRNISLSSTSGLTTDPGVFCGISNNSSWANIGTVTGNTIGAETGTGSISVSISTSGGLSTGISIGGPTALGRVENNKIGSITLAGSTTSVAHNFVGIEVASFTEGQTLTINLNLIGSLTTANSIRQSTALAGALSQGMTGIRIGNLNPVGVITNNTIANLDNAAVSSGSNTFVRGIAVGVVTSSNTITGNIIRNLSTPATNVSGNVSAVLQGIATASTNVALPQSISNNVIHSLINTNTTAGVSVIGIVANWSSTATTLTCTGNLIHSLRTTGLASSNLFGIYIGGGTATYANNMIRLGLDESGNSLTIGQNIAGINEALGTNTIVHNSVYIGGSGVASSNNTFAFLAQQTVNARVFRNNIFVKNRQNASGTAINAAASYAGTFPNAAGLTLDNNIYYPSNSSTLVRNSTTNYSLFVWRAFSNADLSSAVLPDLASINFVNATGTASTVDLHVQSPTAAEGSGFNIATVTTDFDGQTRSGLTPADIGADAGAFTGVDIFTPSISYTALTNTASTSARTLSVTITDGSGIPTSGVGLPVLYWKKNSGSYSAATGSYVSGNEYSFSFGSGVVVNDVVSYYIVAQDLAATPNVNLSPFAGASGLTANPPAVTTPPTTPSSYTIVNGISGNKSVGTGGDYLTLTSFVSYLNSALITGPLTVTLTNSDYSSGETFPLTINANAGSSATNTVTIKPSGACTITGSSASGIIVLNGADYLMIDGSSTGGTSRELTISNASAGTSSAVVWGQTTSGADPVTNLTIKNCNITGNLPTTTLIGVGFGSTTINITSLGTGNNNNRVQNCNVSKAQYGIYSQGASTSNKNTGTVITGNLVNTPSPNNVAKFGILVGFENNISITSNMVAGMNQAGSPDVFGINVGINSVSTTTYTGNEVTNATISNNSVSNIVNSGTFSAVGIGLVPATSGTTTISNNIVYAVSANATSPDLCAGIFVGGGTGSTTNVYHNSVWMNGTITGTGGNQSSIAFAVSGTTPTVNVRNNIFRNTQLPGSGTTKFYAIGLAYSSTLGNYAGLVSENNILDVTSGGGSYLVGITGGLVSGTARTAIADWRTETGRDLLSQQVNPQFHSQSNLHLLPTSPASNAGANLTASVPTDYDGETRTATPDIGADEFVGMTASASGSIAPTTTGSYTAIIALSNSGGVEIKPASYSAGANFTAQYFGSGRTGAVPAEVANLSPYYWVLSTDASSFDVAIRFYFDKIAGNGVVDPSTLRLYRRVGTGNTWTLVTLITKTATYIEVSGLTSFSEFAFGGDVDNPLPVELVNFSAKAKNRNVTLSWETKTETDNSGFEVERKDKNGDWKKIGFVEGFGSSNSPKYYTYEDKKLSSGKHNYRLKQLDNDGTTSYSDEVEVTIDVPTEFALSQNYPNPFNPSTKVDYQLAMDAKVTIELYSITGEKVATLLSQELEAGYYSMMIDSYTHGMASGIYIYRMIATDALGKSFVSTKKLSLIK